MNNLTLGQKLKFFRKRAAMSQLRLEIEIGASFGSISRIENDLVNPTKETIFAIARILMLKGEEIAFIFGIEIKKEAEVSKAQQLILSGSRVIIT